MTDPVWNFAQPGWEQKLRDGSSLLPDLPLNEKDAGQAVGILDRKSVV